MPDRRLAMKIWFCFRGPYDCSAWTALWPKAKLLDFFKGDEIVEKVLREHPRFKQLRVEKHRGENDEDGRVYAWGYNEVGSGEGPDTQHEGVVVYIDDKVVYNDCRFVDSEETDHDPKECDICPEPVA